MNCRMGRRHGLRGRNRIVKRRPRGVVPACRHGLRVGAVLGAAILALSACASAPQSSTGDPSANAGRRGVSGATGVSGASGIAAASEASIRFVHGMLAHHAQALEMAALVPSRSTNETIRLLAERIDVSQRDEIALMTRWLERRGAPVPGPDGAHAQHGDMPGMLTPADMQRLAGASGTAFDRLFLELMIRHHEGALVMVAQLFEAGRGDDPELFQIANHIDADQRAEIDRMRRLLNSLGGAP